MYNQYEEKIRPCIDLVDSLRALGIEKDLSLPAIAVIGDQSSGKSSVLEALSGVALPRGNGKNLLSHIFTLMRWKGLFVLVWVFWFVCFGFVFCLFGFWGFFWVLVFGLFFGFWFLIFCLELDNSMTEAPQGTSKARVPGGQETRSKKCSVV